MARRETIDADPEYLVAPVLPWCTARPVAFWLLLDASMVPVPHPLPVTLLGLRRLAAGVVTGMFGRLSDTGDDPSVRGTPVLAPGFSVRRRRGHEYTARRGGWDGRV